MWLAAAGARRASPTGSCVAQGGALELAATVDPALDLCEWITETRPRDQQTAVGP